MDVFEKEKEEVTKAKQNQSLRERNIELQQVAVASELITAGSFFTFCTSLLFAGNIALIAVIALTGDDVTVLNENVFAYDLQKPAMVKYAPFEKLSTQLETVYQAGLSTLANGEIDCETTRDDSELPNQPEDENGNDKYGCPNPCKDGVCSYPEVTDLGEVAVIDKDACRDRCNAINGGLSRCQRDKIGKMNRTMDVKCRYWIFREKAVYLSGSKVGGEVGSVTRGHRCITLPDYTEAYKNYAPPKLPLATRVVGFSQPYCKLRRYVEKVVEYTRNLTNTIEVDKHTSKLRTFTEQACKKMNLWYVGDYAEGSYYEKKWTDMGDGFIVYRCNTNKGTYTTELQCPCTTYCNIKKCKSQQHIYMYDKDFGKAPPGGKFCFATNRGDEGETYEKCQEACNNDTTCVAFTRTQRYGYGDFTNGYDPATMIQGTLTNVCIMYRHVAGHYGSYADLSHKIFYQKKISHIDSGTRNCEKNDLHSRQYVTYKYTPDIYLPCGTVLDGVSMTGVALQGVQASDMRKCSELCTDEPKCNYWRFDGSACTLFNKATEITTKKNGATSGSRNCVRLCETNIGYVSTDATKSTVDTAVACLGKCKSETTCKKWSWSSSTKDCLLYTSNGAKRNAITGTISGPWYCEIKDLKCPMTGTAILSNKYAIIGPQEHVSGNVTTWEQCAAGCKKTPLCNFWQHSKVPDLSRTTYDHVCVLYGDDKYRETYTTGSKPSWVDTLNMGYRDCQGGSENANGTNNSVSAIISKTPEWFHQPFTCTTSGEGGIMMMNHKNESVDIWDMGLGTTSDKHRTKFAYATSAYDCEQFCFNGDGPTVYQSVTAYNGAYVGWGMDRYGSSRQATNRDKQTFDGIFYRCRCIKDTEWKSAAVERRLKFQPTNQDAAYDMELRYPGCKMQKKLAKKYYPAYHATFVGHGCTNDECMFGAEVGDHVIMSVETPESCIEKCYNYGKTNPVHLLTYSSGYKTCYCHESGAKVKFMGNSGTHPSDVQIKAFRTVEEFRASPLHNDVRYEYLTYSLG